MLGRKRAHGWSFPSYVVSFALLSACGATVGTTDAPDAVTGDARPQDAPRLDPAPDVALPDASPPDVPALDVAPPDVLVAPDAPPVRCDLTGTWRGAVRHDHSPRDGFVPSEWTLAQTGDALTGRGPYLPGTGVVAAGVVTFTETALATGPAYPAHVYAAALTPSCDELVGRHNSTAGPGDWNARRVACDPAVRALALPEDRAEGDFASARRSPVRVCATSGLAAAVHQYALTVAERTGLDLEVTPAAGSTFASAVALRGACVPEETNVLCAAASVGASSGVRAVVEPGTYAVVVGQVGGAPGRYLLTARAFAPVANAACAGATALAPGVATRGDLADAVLSTAPCFAGVERLFYGLRIPGRTRARITMTPIEGAAITPQFDLSAGCDGACGLPGVYVDPTAPATAFTRIVDVREESPRDVVVAVSGGRRGRFEMRADLEPLAYAANATCAGATTVTDGAVLRGEDFRYAATGVADACSDATSERLYYRATVGPGETLQVVATGASEGGHAMVPALGLVESCGAERCLDHQTWPGSEHRIALVYRNAEATARTLVFTAERQRTATVGRFDLNVTVGAGDANARCAGATPVADGYVARDRFVVGGAGDGPIVCPGIRTIHNAAYHRLTLPARHVLEASARSAAASVSGAVVGLLRACDVTACETGGDPALLLRNDTDAPRELVLVVGARDAERLAVPVRYDLDVAITPQPAEATCEATPVVATDGRATTVVRSNQRAWRGPGVPLTCAVLGRAAALFYSVVVPAGQTLGATARTGMGDRLTGAGFCERVELGLIDRCGAGASCDAMGTLFERPSFLGYRNTTGLAQTVLLQAAQGNDCRFDLELAVGPSPYAERDVPAACEPMGAAATLPGFEAAGAVSAVTPLPFAFGLAGDAVGYYSVSSHGYVQLHARADETPAAAAGGEPIPHAGGPDGMIAPLWLGAESGGVSVRSEVRVATLGAAGARRLVVQWSNGGVPGSLNTYQAHVHEGTGAVEFHYCALGTYAASDATVGIESLDGQRGALHSYRDYRALSLTRALRFEPVP